MVEARVMIDSSEKEMKVLLLPEDFYPITAGGAFIDWNVAKHLANAGDRVTVVTPRTGSMSSEEITEGVEIKRPFKGLPEDVPPNSLYGQVRRILFATVVLPYLIYFVWKREFDIIYSTNHLYHPVAFLLHTLYNIPLVTFVGYSPSIHEDVDLTNPQVVLERINFRFFMGNISLCRTRSIYKLLSELSTAEVFQLEGIVDANAVQEAMNREDKHEELLPDESDTRLIFVGRFTGVKNPDLLPQLISQLPSEFSLLMVGDGPMRMDVEAAIEKEGVEERVELAGQLSHITTLQLIHDSDILLLPSKTESYGAVVFEALSLNTPVLATPVGVLPTKDHSKLTLAQHEQFRDVLIEHEFESEQGIDERTLQNFSADHFSKEVRTNLLRALARE